MEAILDRGGYGYPTWVVTLHPSEYELFKQSEKLGTDKAVASAYREDYRKFLQRLLRFIKNMSSPSDVPHITDEELDLLGHKSPDGRHLIIKLVDEPVSRRALAALGLKRTTERSRSVVFAR